MRFFVFFLLISFFSCKRNHTSVLVKTIDNETGQPVTNINIKVYRREKKSLIVAEGISNVYGEELLSFKYDRGNKYSVAVSNNENYWGNNNLPDLEKGKNEAIFNLHPYCYLKLNLKSSSPLDKGLKIEIENENEGFITSKLFYSYSNPMDTVFSYKLRVKAGTKTIKCTVDSFWTIKQTILIPIQLKGNDTAYTIINF